MALELKPGTAIITLGDEDWLLRYMNAGSFLVGERTYALFKDARNFCAERGLRVIHCDATV